MRLIGGSVTPFNRALQALSPAAQRMIDPVTHRRAAVLDQVINQQAQIIAYVDDYVLMICATLPALLLLPLMRRPRVAVARVETREVVAK
jgi:DHA2 family multidrug resistance protein